MDSIPQHPLPTSSSSSAVWRRACVACTKSKRQCSKQVPACRRCSEKGWVCRYLPARRPEGVSAPAHATAEAGSVLSDTGACIPDPPVPPLVDLSSGDALVTDMTFPLLQLTPASSEEMMTRSPRVWAPFSDVLLDPREHTWFLRPDSWIADYSIPPDRPAVAVAKSLNNFIAGVQKWMRQWVTEGSSPLHHAQLYSVKMPRCVQDAYTAFSLYMTKNPLNEDMVHRVLEDRVTQLLQDHVLQGSSSSPSSSSSSSLALGGTPIDIFGHLGRVQALLVYQVIRLFDGDVRMRAQGEGLILTTSLWARQMLQSAKGTLSRPLSSSSSSSSSSLDGPGSGFDIFDGTLLDPAEATWRAWVVAESVRRTWHATLTVLEIYQYLKCGWAECPGCLTLTLRRGLWDAPSAYAWSRACQGERDALFLPASRTDRIVAGTCPSEVDDFGLAVMEVCCGSLKMERWRDEEMAGRETGALGFWDEAF